MWSNKEADFFPEINKSFTFPGMGPQVMFLEQNITSSTDIAFYT